MKRLVIIDGHSILYRAYHALPKMSSKSGKPTNAVYGFVSMMLKTIKDLEPTHLAVVFDRPGGTFRNELYEKYQAHRKKPDDDFIAQIPTVHKLLDVLRVPIFEVDGYEADDIIGTLSLKATNPKSQIANKSQIPNSKLQTADEIIIVTSDRDQLQLVDNTVKLFMPVKGLSNAKLFGEKETIKRMGVPPEQVVDFKALAGDASDNIPGVSGIGPKTATELLKKFKTLENLYQQLEKVEKNSVREKLETNKDMAFVSKKLATIVTHVPLEFDIAKCSMPDLVRTDVVEYLNKLGFKSLVKRLTGVDKKPAEKKEKAASGEPNEENPPSPRLRRTREQLGLF